jgi:hypothetical protein
MHPCERTTGEPPQQKPARPNGYYQDPGNWEGVGSPVT